jgi:hypothetical protein
MHDPVDLLEVLEDRESDRFKFIDGLLHAIRDAEERFERKQLHADLIIVIAQWLRGRGTGAVAGPVEALISGPVADFFRNELLPAILKFSSFPDEQNVVAAEILGKMSEQLTGPFHSDLLSLTMHHRAEYLTGVGKLKETPET